MKTGTNILHEGSCDIVLEGFIEFTEAFAIDKNITSDDKIK